MPDIFQITVLSVVQGLTEFLPVSSSGHLILVPALTDWADQGETMDVAVHVGSLIAVILYFRRDLWTMIAGLFRLFSDPSDSGGREALKIALATVPVVAVGLGLNVFDIARPRTVPVVATALAVFGLLLWGADYWGERRKAPAEIGWPHALLIGAAQCLALIPGTSRSGITMTAARLTGVSRPAAARFSFLLSIPAIAGAGFLTAIELFSLPECPPLTPFLSAIGLSCLAALGAIRFLMAYVRHAGFAPFSIYRLLLAGSLFFFL